MTHPTTHVPAAHDGATTEDDPVVEVTALSHRFGRKKVLDGVELAVPRGSVTALLGQNGEGKTTLLRLLIGWLPPKRGRISVLGMDPARRGPDVRRAVGYVPHELPLPKWMRVADYFRFLEPFYPSWNRDEEARLLERLELDPKAKVKTLSKGQKAKHALIAALAHEPELLLLDEPFSGLDPLVRHDVLTAVLGHLRDDGRTVLVVSHSLVDVERIADRLAFMEGGRITMSGDLEEIARKSVRLAVTLRDPDEIWSPPGHPASERAGADVVLSYVQFDPRYEASLESDPKVRSVRRMNRGLDDVFRGAVAASAPATGAVSAEHEEVTPCRAQ